LSRDLGHTNGAGGGEGVGVLDGLDVGVVLGELVGDGLEELSVQ
jgi:hypothetical protein